MFASYASMGYAYIKRETQNALLTVGEKIMKLTMLGTDKTVVTADDVTAENIELRLIQMVAKTNLHNHPQVQASARVKRLTAQGELILTDHINLITYTFQLTK